MILIYLLIFIFILNYFVRQSKWFKLKYQDIEKFSKIKRNICIYNTGSTSSKFAFDYKSIDIKGFNAAIGPQTLYFDKQLLIQNINRVAKGGVVIITFVPFSSILDKYKSKSSNDKYYFILNKSLIPDYDVFRHIFVLMSYYIPLLSLVMNIRILKSILVFKSNNANLQYNLMNNKQLDEDASGWVNVWLKQFDIENLNDDIKDDHINIMKQNQQIVLDMIKICKEKNINPVIIIPPYTKYLNKYLSESIINKYLYDFLLPIRQMTNIDILTYQDDESLVDKDNFFNSFFFNKKGAALFTKKVVDQVIINCND